MVLTGAGNAPHVRELRVAPVPTSEAAELIAGVEEGTGLLERPGHQSAAMLSARTTAGCAVLLVAFVIFAAVYGPPSASDAIRAADGMRRAYEAPNSVDANATAKLKLQVCGDAADWTDGYSVCQTNGYKGPHCTPTGYTCEAYAFNGWCYMGKVLDSSKQGYGRNHPEEHCCACGGGSTSRKLPEPAAGSSSKTCAAHTACSSLSGSCCPTETGEMLACCSSSLVCEDRAQWTNGYTKCQEEGLTEADGCTPGGLDCAGYVHQGICKDGAVVDGKESMAGAAYNYPEVNCCACGRGTPKVAAKTAWLEAIRKRDVDDAELSPSEVHQALKTATEGAQTAAVAAQAGVQRTLNPQSAEASFQTV